MVNSIVKMWEEDVTIPTYKVGIPDKNPMFLEKRVYQGSSGKVYPYPVIDKIEDEKVDKKYHAVYIENEYLKVMILPELGGRIQRAYDKTNNYDFVYYNEVIKPALVGLAGPWISGGIEFNWPQHHRPSTFSPVDYYLEENSDGSKTVWVNEIDSMNGTKGMAGFTLYPDKAYIEIKGQLYNRTNLDQTFLWWANPAVSANEHTMSVFPPDVHAVYDHGKRDVSTYPIATGTYYKVDYSAGVDISRYKNIPVPTSYMANSSDYDFVGGYDENIGAGILHVADHHISPGKKQWTWGFGDFGQAWDRNLTDNNGPYIELMTGVFTDNQPDFIWLKPFEEKSFKQYFMPYKEVGRVKAANIDVALSLEITENSNQDNIATIIVYATSLFEASQIVLKDKVSNRIYLESRESISPTLIYKAQANVCNCLEQDLVLTVYDSTGNLIISYEWETVDLPEIPEPAIPVLEPKEVKSLEELYLIGLHIEQFRHATYDPEQYYLEGLKRDSTDIRLNTAYGTLLLRQGLFAESEPYFKEAIKKMTMRNPNPYNSEAMYQLGLSYYYRSMYEDAYKQFRKAAWSNEQQENSFYYIAAIEVIRGDYQKALEFVNLGLIKNSHNIKARGLKCSILRHLHKYEEAKAFVQESLGIDKFDYRTRFDEYLLKIQTEDITGANQNLTKMKELMRGSVNTYLEIATDYGEVGLYQEAIALLQECKSKQPMLKYYEAYYLLLMGEVSKADICFEEAKNCSSLYCFPNKLADILVLEKALERNKNDAKACYYLGNLWYDKKQYEKACACFEQSMVIDKSFPTVHRNLALYYYNKKQDAKRARYEMETAYSLDLTDARIFLELDQLYKKTGVSIEARLKLYEENQKVFLLRDDLYTEYVTLHNLLGQYEKAFHLIMERKFHPWEGGEGKISSQYIIALTQMARALLEKPQLEKLDRASDHFEIAGVKAEVELAISYLKRAREYPHNLGEGKLPGAQENNILYYMGCAYEKLGDTQVAREHFRQASIGLSEPTGMMFYNDQPADMILYQGLANLKLGEKEIANEKFNKLITYGEKHMNEHIKIDFFAVSLPDFLIFDENLDNKNNVHCYYLLGLGNYGLGKIDKALEAFIKAEQLDNSNCGVVIHKRLISR